MTGVRRPVRIEPIARRGPHPRREASPQVTPAGAPPRDVEAAGTAEPAEHAPGAAPRRFLAVDRHDLLDVLDGWRLLAVAVTVASIVGPTEVLASSARVVAVALAGYLGWSVLARWYACRRIADRWTVSAVSTLLDGTCVAALIWIADEAMGRFLVLGVAEAVLVTMMAAVRTGVKVALWPTAVLVLLVATEDPGPHWASDALAVAAIAGSFPFAVAIVAVAGRLGASLEARPLGDGPADSWRELPFERAGQRTRAWCYAAVAAVALLLPFVSRLEPSMPRAVIGFAAALLAPGAAVTGWARVRDPLHELLLAVGGSLVLTILTTQVMLSLHWWHPRVLTGSTAIAGLIVAFHAWNASRAARNRLDVAAVP